MRRRISVSRRINVKNLRQILKGTKWSGKQYFQYCVPNALIYKADRLNCCSECSMFIACKCRLLEDFGDVLK